MCLIPQNGHRNVTETIHEPITHGSQLDSIDDRNASVFSKWDEAKVQGKEKSYTNKLTEDHTYDPSSKEIRIRYAKFFMRHWII